MTVRMSLNMCFKALRIAGIPLALVVVLMAGGAIISTGQQPSQQTEGKTDAEREKALEETLVEGSRSAILQTGISAEYFDEHFKLLKVINSPADRRVVWKFSVNEYETIVQDAIGSYTVENEKRDTHTVTTALTSMTEIRKTIPRRQAERKLRACIGKFDAPAVELRSGENGVIGLFLTASAVPVPEPEAAETISTPGKQETVAQSERTDMSRDQIKEKGKRRDPTVLGAVNLQTGKCTKGLGLVGPRPSKAK